MRGTAYRGFVLCLALLDFLFFFFPGENWKPRDERNASCSSGCFWGSERCAPGRDSPCIWEALHRNPALY